MKSALIVANWKSYLNYFHIETLILEKLREFAYFIDSLSDIQIVCCPSFESLSLIKAAIDSKKVILGAQDCSAYSPGAHTGDVTAQSLQSMGCSYVILGHSERRRYVHENSDLIAQKMMQCFDNDLIPIICCGEMDQHTALTHRRIFQEQLTAIFKVLKNNPSYQIIFAYEPLWAIGTGKTPTITQISTACEILRELIDQAQIANSYRILYGGSIDSNTINELKEAPVDGFLIGKASTDFQELKKIVSCLISNTYKL